MNTKIQLLGSPKIIMENPYGKDNFFAWPTVAKVQNKKILVAASGYRYAHICPFGKAVLSYSEDDGETYTIPAPVINTPLDDRDAGILAFGKSNVIITSFNNTVAFQQHYNETKVFEEEVHFRSWADKDLVASYLHTITQEEEQTYLGSEFRISNDHGVTFGPLHKSPVTSPHGPLALEDGSLLWVGRIFDITALKEGQHELQAHKINPDGSMEYVGSIPPIYVHGQKIMSYEPHAIALPNGSILCHIRAEWKNLFTIYQSVSYDNGATWTEPTQILSDQGGAPAHLMLHSSGVLISSYGYRSKPYGIRIMFSYDNGATWDTDHEIYKGISPDLGYPSTVELENGDLLTVFYDHRTSNAESIILQQKWKF